jgi:hypothetical protein
MTSSLHDRPTAQELVQAVREYLEHDVVPGTEGRLSFHARVAANVLAMVERELDLGPALDAHEQLRLERLLGHEGSITDLTAELARRIRDGSLDARRGDVVELLRASVLAKLAVANPTYAEPQP